MNRTVKFVLIVTFVSGATSFLLTALTAGTPARDNPPFIGLAFGMVAGIAYMLLTGNRKVAFADDEARRLALAEVSPANGMARILVVRQVRVGVMVGVDVTVDGRVLAQLKSPRFASQPLVPGPHEIGAVAQGRRTKPMVVELTAGETAIVRVSAGLGGIKLTREVDSPELRAALAKVPMVETPADALA